MNIAIAGYGRMGKQIEKAAEERKINIVSKIDPFAPGATHKEINSDSLKGVDVVIDFTLPDGIIDNIKKYVDNGVSVVMGTTGWYDRKDEVEEIIGDKIGFIWSGNFSIGVNIFFKIIEKSTRIFNNFMNDYDVMLHEFHHKMKKDSPSGTAYMMAEVVKDNLDCKDKIVTNRLDREPAADEIHLSSTRGGYIPGTHSVIFDSLADTVELKHTARTREGFAIGAVLASQWVSDRKGFFHINDFLDNLDI